MMSAAALNCLRDYFTALSYRVSRCRHKPQRILPQAQCGEPAAQDRPSDVVESAIRSMATCGNVPQVAPFESATEFRDAHARLLEALDKELGDDASAAAEAAALARLEPRIREFLERGSATGHLRRRDQRSHGVPGIAGLSGCPACRRRVDRLPAFAWPVSTGEQLPDLKDKPCPYVGLDAFRDRTFFFGREADIRVAADPAAERPRSSSCSGHREAASRPSS